MSEAPGPAVSPNAPQTCSTLSLPPQITPQGNQLPMIAATWHAPGPGENTKPDPHRTRTLSARRTSRLRAAPAPQEASASAVVRIAVGGRCGRWWAGGRW